MDFIVTMRAKAGNTERFVVTAVDEVEVRDILRRHHAAGDRKHYPAPGGGRVDVVWRNISFPDPVSIDPVPCS
jgi:hypothetical protein